MGRHSGEEGQVVVYDEPLGRKLELMLMWKG